MSVTRAEAMCIRCMKVKARTEENWRKRAGCRDGLEPRVCRVCQNEATRLNSKLLGALEEER